jgi:hypothetical protein
MKTAFEQYVTEHQLDTRNIFRVAGVRYATVYYALQGQPILPESAEKIRTVVLQLTGVPYTGPFVLFTVAAPPVTPQRR